MLDGAIFSNRSRGGHRTRRSPNEVNFRAPKAFLMTFNAEPFRLGWVASLQKYFCMNFAWKFMQLHEFMQKSDKWSEWALHNRRVTTEYQNPSLVHIPTSWCSNRISGACDMRPGSRIDFCMNAWNAWNSCTFYMNSCNSPHFHAISRDFQEYRNTIKNWNKAAVMCGEGSDNGYQCQNEYHLRYRGLLTVRVPIAVTHIPSIFEWFSLKKRGYHQKVRFWA